MYELVLRAPQALVEPVSDALMDEWGALSVSVEDADAGTAGEQALFGEPGLPAPAAGWQQSTLTALFDGEAAAERAATGLLAQEGAAGLDDAHLALGFGDLELGDIRLRDEVDQGLEFPQVHGDGLLINSLLWRRDGRNGPAPQAAAVVRSDSRCCSASR